jgi:hypothetical protein
MKSKEGHEQLITKEAVITFLSKGKSEGIPTTENQEYITWVIQEEEAAESDSTGDARIKLSIDTAEVLFRAGYIDEAKDTIHDVGEQLQAQGGEEAYDLYVKIEELIYGQQK